MSDQEQQQETGQLKTCFVVMPISDADGYLPGHFTRVYNHIIKPACKEAGFEAFRADDVKQTNMIILDILQRIVAADLVVCDLSSKNPNVMYELGIRQAFNLPVVLLKDTSTDRIFDISSLRDVGYDESLRIDTVQAAVVALSESIRETWVNRDTDTHSLIRLLGIDAATLPEKTQIGADTRLILEELSALRSTINNSSKPIGATRMNASRTVLENLDDSFTKNKIMQIKNSVGSNVIHPHFGFGRIIGLDGDDVAIVRLENGETRRIHPPYDGLIHIIDASDK
ncbi:hypothetical protein CIG75_12655 [Tumebacillus algifaecis]|uniref:Nucleoside 2-deoxyribosyltransferase n=1 Tax=Tumebacillus algifaecis TaxID=1214604 RepID=A0A223D215_9BACL|nr:hypothetical protein [Tumebacillus algifaecis]ASS75749.1 hypothetical protein CIG75_12655 [Tumebacillus algifaecis]